MSQQNVLEIKNLSVHYSNKIVLDNIALALQPGEFVGVIGQNGAGKSTLLRVILGLLRPTNGDILIDNQLGKKAIRQIGYVPQKIHLEPDTPLRGRDLVGLGLDGHRFGIPLPSRSRREKIEQALTDVNALSFADQPVGKLSGGEQQRLLIAQAMLTNPKILLLDEPLSNLDIRSAHEIVRLVAKLSKEQGLAVLFVSHDMNPLIGAMDKVMYLANGRSVMGTVEEVVQTSVLSELYGYHVEVLHVQNRILIVGGVTDDQILDEHTSELDNHKPYQDVMNG